MPVPGLFDQIISCVITSPCFISLIETILSKDNEIVQTVMANTLSDYREMEKNSN